MTAISYTAARLFEDCPARYKAERIDGIKAEPSLPMKQGAFVHATVEAYSKKVLEFGEGGNALARSLGEHLWRNAAHGLPEIVKEECLRLSVTTAEAISLDPDKVIGVEVEIAVDEQGGLVPYDSESAAVRGRIDRLEVSDAPEGSALVVWDLKAGRAIENPNESVQLPLYTALARAIQSASKFIGKLYYPRHEVERVAEISSDRADAALKWALDIRSKVSALRAARGAWPETPGRGCAECPLYWTCESRKRVAGRHIAIPQTESDAAEMVIKAELLSREISEIKEMLKLFVERNGAIQVNGLVADIAPRYTYKWPVKRLLEVLAKRGIDFAGLVKGDTRRLSRAALKHPGLGDELEAIRDDKTSTALSIRRFGSEPKIFGGDDEDK